MTGVQTCALPIFALQIGREVRSRRLQRRRQPGRQRSDRADDDREREHAAVNLKAERQWDRQRELIASSARVRTYAMPIPTAAPIAASTALSVSSC